MYFDPDVPYGKTVFIVFLFVGMFVALTRDDDSQQFTVIEVSVGDDVVLKWNDSDQDYYTYVATNDTAWDAMWEALDAGQTRWETLGDQLVKSGQVVEVRYGTRARILVVESVRHKVRLMDGRHAGVTGWVYMHEVQR